MATPPPFRLEEIQAFATRYGLTRLAPEHLQRMCELAVYVSDLGCRLPRVPSKSDAPPRFDLYERERAT